MVFWCNRGSKIGMLQLIGNFMAAVTALAGCNPCGLFFGVSVGCIGSCQLLLPLLSLGSKVGYNGTGGRWIPWSEDQPFLPFLHNLYHLHMMNVSFFISFWSKTGINSRDVQVWKPLRLAWSVLLLFSLFLFFSFLLFFSSPLFFPFPFVYLSFLLQHDMHGMNGMQSCTADQLQSCRIPCKVTGLVVSSPTCQTGLSFFGTEGVRAKWRRQGHDALESSDCSFCLYVNGLFLYL